MNNFFLLQSPYTSPKKGRIARYTTALLRKMGLKYQLLQDLDVTQDMNSIEQRINYYHLLKGILDYGVEGDIVELGCFTGQCALLFQKILSDQNSNRTLHLFDSFEHQFAFNGDVKAELLRRFGNEGFPFPILHQGYFEETVPNQLPEQIAFAHIDCGFGGNADDHRRLVLYCLKHLYPRMPKGAVAVLMDYHEGSNFAGQDLNPGVKLACDDFFADKTEKMVALYGNQYAHGFFRKM